jgi:site-specific DNA recombinase
VEDGWSWQGQLAKRWPMKITNANYSKGRDTMKTKNRAAVYARFSSDLQKDTSVEDQFLLCNRFAERQGYKVVAKFCDRAKSATTLHDRDGLFKLREAAKRGEFDLVIVESFDRLSRDLEDSAGLFKRLTHYGVDIMTVNEGKATTIQVGLRGIISEMFIKDLSAKVRRGHQGHVERELFPGNITYGYERIWDEEARVYRAGQRAIYEPEAKIVRRIFKEYAGGKSPRKICIGLSNDGILSPNGNKLWNHMVLLGGKGCRGILNNRLYIGEIVWNQCYFDKDPDDKKKLIKRHRPESEHITKAVPHLRIIDQVTWNAVQAVRESRSTKHHSQNRIYVPRNYHLLSGLVQCAVCQSHMVIAQKTAAGGPRMKCATAHYRSACEHKKSYDLSVIERTVIDGFKENLVDVESIKEMTKRYHTRRKENEQKSGTERAGIEKKLAALQLQIDRIVTAVSDTDQPLPALMKSLEVKEAERVGLEERLRLLKSENLVSLHPASIENYKTSVDTLHRALTNGRVYSEAEKQAFRNLIDKVVVHPTGHSKPYEVSVYGRLSAMLGVELFPNMRTAEQIVQEERIPNSATASGNSYAALRNSTVQNSTTASGTSYAASRNSTVQKPANNTLFLGKWSSAKLGA